MYVNWEEDIAFEHTIAQYSPNDNRNKKRMLDHYYKLADIYARSARRNGVYANICAKFGVWDEYIYLIQTGSHHAKLCRHYEEMYIRKALNAD